MQSLSRHNPYCPTKSNLFLSSMKYHPCGQKCAPTNRSLLKIHFEIISFIVNLNHHLLTDMELLNGSFFVETLMTFWAEMSYFRAFDRNFFSLWMCLNFSFVFVIYVKNFWKALIVGEQFLFECWMSTFQENIQLNGI